MSMSPLPFLNNSAFRVTISKSNATKGNPYLAVTQGPTQSFSEKVMGNNRSVTPAFYFWIHCDNF